MKDRDTA